MCFEYAAGVGRDSLSFTDLMELKISIFFEVLLGMSQVTRFFHKSSCSQAMHPLPDAPCFQRLPGTLVGACLVKVTLSPFKQKIENQGQPFQNQHLFHRMATYVFGRHCFLRVCWTDKVKPINNHKSAYEWFFIFAFSVTAAGLVANI